MTLGEVARRFGVAAHLPYSTASVDVRTGSDGAEAKLDLGGLALGAGVRLYF